MKSILSVLIAVTLSSCGSNSSAENKDPAPKPTPSAPPAELLGTWNGGCIPYYGKPELAFSADGTFAGHVTHISNSWCGDETVEYDFAGTYSGGSPAPTQDSAETKKLSLTITKFTVVTHSKTVRWDNCGVSLTPDVPADIFGKTCDQNYGFLRFSAGGTFQEIYSASATGMKFGEISNRVPKPGTTTPSALGEFEYKKK